MYADSTRSLKGIPKGSRGFFNVIRYSISDKLFILCHFSSFLLTLEFPSFNVKLTWFTGRVCHALLTSNVNFTVTLSAGYTTMPDGVNK